MASAITLNKVPKDILKALKIIIYVLMEIIETDMLVQRYLCLNDTEIAEDWRGLSSFSASYHPSNKPNYYHRLFTPLSESLPPRWLSASSPHLPPSLPLPAASLPSPPPSTHRFRPHSTRPPLPFPLRFSFSSTFPIRCFHPDQRYRRKFRIKVVIVRLKHYVWNYLSAQPQKWIRKGKQYRRRILTSSWQARIRLSCHLAQVGGETLSEAALFKANRVTVTATVASDGANTWDLTLPPALGGQGVSASIIPSPDFSIVYAPHREKLRAEEGGWLPRARRRLLVPVQPATARTGSRTANFCTILHLWR